MSFRISWRGHSSPSFFHRHTHCIKMHGAGFTWRARSSCAACAWPLAGLAICFCCALKTRSVFAWAMSAVAAWIPLQAAIFYGRREPTALFLISLGMSLFFLREKQAPRFVVIGAVLGAMFIIPAVGEYR